jgi:hypothetical protein
MQAAALQGGRGREARNAGADYKDVLGHGLDCATNLASPQRVSGRSGSVTGHECGAA